jgi:hypothetical protein
MKNIMKNHLGIDHPLIAVRDMDNACEDFKNLGFYINPRHHHPWGTDNHLLMFPESFIELISVYDASKLDIKNERGFAFGRFIDDSINRREGISLVALHSEDARSDYQLMEQRGVENNGIVDFRRVAHRPDGSEDEAVVSLVMLINKQYPAISHFFCHQHKPELVLVEEWMKHPNGANGFVSVCYVAKDPSVFATRFEGIYGEQMVTITADHLHVQTDRGSFEIMTVDRAKTRFNGVSIPASEGDLPTGIALCISTLTPEKAKSLFIKNNIKFIETEDNILRVPSKYAGNTIIEFHPDNS